MSGSKSGRIATDCENCGWSGDLQPWASCPKCGVSGSGADPDEIRTDPTTRAATQRLRLRKLEPVFRKPDDVKEAPPHRVIARVLPQNANANSARVALKSERAVQARALREQGWSISRIAKTLEVHPRTISRYLANGRDELVP